MTTQEKNELVLAKFMNIRQEPDGFTKSKKLYWHYSEINEMSDVLLFHSDPKWLLPVSYKFRNLANEYYNSFNSKEYRSIIAMDYSHHTQSIRKSFGEGTFTDLYDSLVNAVQWYNSINQK